MKILVITDYLPYPLISGDRIRVYNLVRRIADCHQVTLAGPIRSEEDLQSEKKLAEFCEQVITGNLHMQHPLRHLPGLVRFALDGLPLELKFLHSATLEAKIRKAAAEGGFDIVQVEHSRMAYYLRALPEDLQRKSVLTLHNITYDQFGRISQVELNPVQRFRASLYSRQMRDWEPRYAGRFARVVVVSRLDQEMVLELNPHLHTEVIPNGVDVQRYQPLPVQRDDPVMLFIGTMSYAPCVDGAIFFSQQVLPLIRKAIPNARFLIVGADPDPEVRALESEAVEVTGRVPEIEPYYSRASICVVPLRAGGGTRLKILEAMAFGRPVVSTSIGCEGLEVRDGQDLLVADEPEKIAAQVIRLLTDKDLYRQIADEARKTVEAQYDWDAIAGRLMDIYQELNPTRVA